MGTTLRDARANWRDVPVVVPPAAPGRRSSCGITNDDATLFLLEWRGGSADHLAQLDA